jgi:hypothetical protein
MTSNADLTGEALIAAMQASPRRNIDIEPQRAAMPVRSLDGLLEILRETSPLTPMGPHSAKQR